MSSVETTAKPLNEIGPGEMSSHTPQSSRKEEGVAV